MAAVKWIFVVIFGLGSAGSLAMAFVESGGPRQPIERKAPEIALRDFPQMTVAAAKAPEAAKTPEPVAGKDPAQEPAKEPEKAPEPVAAKEPEKAPEAAKTPEPVAAKPPEPKPEPVAAAKPPEPKPEPVAAKPPEPKPAPVAAKPPEPKPEPVAAAPKPPEPKAEPAAAAQGSLNLRASDTADVYLDGKKLGGSPLMGIKAKVGNHKVRFDCYDAAGNTVAGPSQTVAVKADQEVEVEFTCPSE